MSVYRTTPSASVMIANASPPARVATMPSSHDASAAVTAIVTAIAGIASQPCWARYPNVYAPTASHAA